jgi:hypothetical protein
LPPCCTPTAAHYQESARGADLKPPVYGITMLMGFEELKRIPHKNIQPCARKPNENSALAGMEGYALQKAGRWSAL